LKKVLIVDDEIQMQKLLSVCLQSEQFITESASSGEEAIQLLEKNQYDMVLLDIMMPGIDGFDVLKKLRSSKIMTPVILLTALGETEAVVKGLNLGADDYVTKPFEPSELIARVSSVLRRVHSSTQIVGLTGQNGIVLDQKQRQFTFEGRKIDFTKKEYQIFLRLVLNHDQVYTREELLELEWNGPEERFDRSVDTHIKNIREKIKQAGVKKQLIETVWGVGYKFSQTEDSQ
jgi:two-component system response regulator ResD